MEDVDEVIQKEVYTRLRGFERFARLDFALLGSLLTQKEFILYLYLKEIATIWDNRNPKYGSFIRADTTTRLVLGWTQRTLSANFNSLLKKGITSPADMKSNIYRVVGFHLVKTYKIDSEYLQDICWEIARNRLKYIAHKKEGDDDMQDTVTEEAVYSSLVSKIDFKFRFGLSSFKSTLGSVTTSTGMKEIFTDAELDRIGREIDTQSSDESFRVMGADTTKN